MPKLRRWRTVWPYDCNVDGHLITVIRTPFNPTFKSLYCTSCCKALRLPTSYEEQENLMSRHFRWLKGLKETKELQDQLDSVEKYFSRILKISGVFMVV